MGKPIQEFVEWASSGTSLDSDVQAYATDGVDPMTRLNVSRADTVLRRTKVSDASTYWNLKALKELVKNPKEPNMSEQLWYDLDLVGCPRCTTACMGRLFSTPDELARHMYETNGADHDLKTAIQHALKACGLDEYGNAQRLNGSSTAEKSAARINRLKNQVQENEMTKFYRVLQTTDVVVKGAILREECDNYRPISDLYYIDEDLEDTSISREVVENEKNTGIYQRVYPLTVEGTATGKMKFGTREQAVEGLYEMAGEAE